MFVCAYLGWSVCWLVCVCACMRVCVCVGQSVKVGLAWSHDITSLRGLLASQTAPPPPSPLPLTTRTPSHTSRLEVSVFLRPLPLNIWFKAKTKSLRQEDRSVGVSSTKCALHSFAFFSHQLVIHNRTLEKLEIGENVCCVCECTLISFRFKFVKVVL